MKRQPIELGKKKSLPALCLSNGYYLEYTKSWGGGNTLTTKKTNNPFKNWGMNLEEPPKMKCRHLRGALSCGILALLCVFLVPLFKGKHFSFSKGIASVTFKNFDSSRYSSLPTEITEFRNINTCSLFEKQFEFRLEGKKSVKELLSNTNIFPQVSYLGGKRTCIISVASRAKLYNQPETSVVVITQRNTYWLSFPGVQKLCFGVLQVGRST